MIDRYQEIRDREKEILRKKIAEIDRNTKISMIIIYISGALIVGFFIYFGFLFNIFGK